MAATDLLLMTGGGKKIQIKSETIAVMQWEINSDSMGEPSFCCRIKSIWIAKVIPAKTAATSPFIWPRLSESAKNKHIPITIAMSAPICSGRGFSFNITPERSITYTGAPY